MILRGLCGVARIRDTWFLPRFSFSRWHLLSVTRNPSLEIRPVCLTPHSRAGCIARAVRDVDIWRLSHRKWQVSRNKRSHRDIRAKAASIIVIPWKVSRRDSSRYRDNAAVHAYISICAIERTDRIINANYRACHGGLSNFSPSLPLYSPSPSLSLSLSLSLSFGRFFLLQIRRTRCTWNLCRHTAFDTGIRFDIDHWCPARLPEYFRILPANTRVDSIEGGEEACFLSLCAAVLRVLFLYSR